MTFWTGLMAMMTIIAQSCMDVVGLEYNSKYQVLTDWQFDVLTGFVITVAIIVDLSNYWHKPRGLK